MTELQSVLTVIFVTFLRLVRTEEICCCPDLSVYLRCKDSGDSPRLSNSGNICYALDSTDVTIQCQVGDAIHPAVQSIKYSYYKANEIHYGPVAGDLNRSKKLSSCPSNSASCTLRTVRWSGDVFSNTKLLNYDNFLYQCQVEVTLIDGSSFKLYSNTLTLQIYKASTRPTAVYTQEDVVIKTNTAFKRLQCGGSQIALTNPPSRAKWSYKSNAGGSYVALWDVPRPRAAVIEGRIVDEGAFPEGTLVLMMFDPEQDCGYYQCELVYPDTELGAGSSYVRAIYKVTGNNQLDDGSPDTKVLSTSISVDRTLITAQSPVNQGDMVYFTCYARDTDASLPALFTWVYETQVSYEPVDPNKELFKDVKFLDYNRVMVIPASYELYDVKFKCKVQRDKQSNYILSDQFVLPIIFPKISQIPLTTKTCVSGTEAIKLNSNSELMSSDKLQVYPYTQKLTGAINRWMLNGVLITAFDNPEESGGVTKEDQLKITSRVFNNSEAFTNTDNKCQYLTFLQTRSNGYQLHENFKVTRDYEACQDVTDCSGLDIEFTCGIGIEDDYSFTISLAGSMPQCIGITITDFNSKIIYKAWFPNSQTADSCLTRTLKTRISKADMFTDVDPTESYVVTVGPEGKRGCNRNLNLGSELVRCREQAPDLGTDPGKVESVTEICPAEYEDSGTATPWRINGSNSCEVEISQLARLGIQPGDTLCYQVTIADKSEYQVSQSICALGVPIKNLTHDTVYELSWQAESSQLCKTQIQVVCKGGCGRGTHCSLALLLSILISYFISR